VGKELRGDINKQTTVMGRIHVCSAYVSPCDDPEDQIVLLPYRSRII
jgi:hypothetical protein